MSDSFVASTCDPVLTRQSLLQSTASVVSPSILAQRFVDVQTTVSSPPTPNTAPIIVSLAVFLSIAGPFLTTAQRTQLANFPSSTTIVVQTVGGVPAPSASINPIIAINSTGNRFYISLQGIVNYSI
jgi:hypothetical protein